MNAGNMGDSDTRGDGGSGRPNHGGSDWEAATAAVELRSAAKGNPQSVAQLRKAIDRSTPNGKWADAALIVGSIILGLMIVVTMLTALAVNARANRLVEADETRARESPIVVERLERKLDGVVADVAEIKNTVSTTTTTTIARRTPSTGTTVRPRTTTTTRPPTTTTTRPSPPRTSPPTTRPCLLALGDLCIL